MHTKNNKMPNAKERADMAQAFIDSIIPTVALSAGYIDLETTKFISGYTREGAKRALSRLSRQGFMSEHKLQNMTGQKINIYGLTKEGWEYAEVDRGNWTKKRYRANTRNHEMTILKIAHRIGLSEFKRGENIGGKILPSGGFSGGRYPDLMDINDSAIEIELTIKSSKRYLGILSNYHRNNTHSKWYVPEKIGHRLVKNFKETCEKLKISEPEIYFFNDQLKLILANPPQHDEKENFESLDDLNIYLAQKGQSFNSSKYKFNPDLKGEESKKGIVIYSENGFQIIARLLNEDSNIITEIFWKEHKK